MSGKGSVRDKLRLLGVYCLAARPSTAELTELEGMLKQSAASSGVGGAEQEAERGLGAIGFLRQQVSVRGGCRCDIISAQGLGWSCQRGVNQLFHPQVTRTRIPSICVSRLTKSQLYSKHVYGFCRWLTCCFPCYLVNLRISGIFAALANHASRGCYGRGTLVRT